jgi:hypothetical protein
MLVKFLVTGIVIVILALSAIGTAFATGMNISNVGILSSGGAEIPQVNVDHVGFISSPDGQGVDRIAISFDRDLVAGSTIWVTISGEIYGYEVLANPLAKNAEIIIHLQMIIKTEDIGSGMIEPGNIVVTVAER